MKTIRIIGGGLAGLTLGIGLRQRGVPVDLIEAGTYPRHRVCGEFINGQGLESLHELGLIEIIRQAGALPAQEAGFFTTSGLIARHRLPAEALCISRFVLDATLVGKFCELGGKLKTGERWHDGELGEGMIVATGRRRRATENGFRWFGLKVHAQNVSLEADLEMHLHNGAYVGLCRLSDGIVNICGLFRRSSSDVAVGDVITRLRGQTGSLLFNRLEHARFDRSSLCSVGGLSFHDETIDESECRVGDALTMIPPVTGNGMSMAFESAICALGPLHRYARGQQDWREATQEIAGVLSRRFGRRLFCARFLHDIMFSRIGQMGQWLRVPPLWRAAFSLTR